MHTHPVVSIWTLSLTIWRWRRHWEGRSRGDDVRAICVHPIVHTVGFVEMPMLLKNNRIRIKGKSQKHFKFYVVQDHTHTHTHTHTVMFSSLLGTFT